MYKEITTYAPDGRDYGWIDDGPHFVVNEGFNSENHGMINNGFTGV